MKRSISSVGIFALVALFGPLALLDSRMSVVGADTSPLEPPAPEDGYSSGTETIADAPADPAPPDPTAIGNQAPPSTPAEQPAPKSAGSGPGLLAPILDSTSARLSFQALLKDGGGVPLVGPVNLRFQVYTSPGGVAVGAPIDVLGVPLTNGVADTQVPVPTSSFDGTGRQMGVSVNGGAELAPRIQLTAVPYAYRVDRVASEELDDSIALGRGVAPLASGLLRLHDGAQAQATIELLGNGSRISTYGSDGLEQIRLWGPTWGELWLNDITNNNTTVFLSATGSIVDTGGVLQLRDADGATRVDARGQSTGTGGELSLYDDDGTETVEILGAQSAAEGGNIYIRNAVGTNTIQLDGDSGDAAFVGLRNTAGSNRITLDGDSSGAGFISLYQNDGSTGVTIDGDNGTNQGGIIAVRDSVSGTRIQLDGESAGTGGEISVFDNDGTETVEILGAEDSTTGGQILLRNSAGVTTIQLDAEFVSGATNDGRIVTQELQITGGSDLSEHFDILDRSTGKPAEPGSVVCIDPKNPGKLVVSEAAYDRTVAGVISGAGGVKSGLMMAQRNSLADGQLPVALTGRVYCRCDASNGAIQPGDLLTSSPTSGHAMKVTDHTKAQGAILGKAMTSLESGRGLVLVLVTLQ